MPIFINFFLFFIVSFFLIFKQINSYFPSKIIQGKTKGNKKVTIINKNEIILIITINFFFIKILYYYTFLEMVEHHEYYQFQ